jgi:predicted permease
MSDWLADIRQAVRVVRKTPGFAAVVVLTLALGVGANTAIFSVVNAVLLRPFAVREPDRLVVVWENRIAGGSGYMFASPPNYGDWRTRSQSFEDLGAFAPQTFFLSGGDETLRIDGAHISASLLRALAVAPLHGRVFTEDEDRPGAGNVVLLGHALWQRRFGSDPAIVGQDVQLDNGRYTVIGVMPPDFDFPPPIDLEGRTLPRRNELWVPLALDLPVQNRSAHYLTVIGRLREGVTRAAASAEMVSLATQMQQEFPESNAQYSVALVPFSRVVVGEAKTALLVLLGAVSAVLLIACVNIANLLLARATGRQTEYAVRAALGAGRPQLFRQAVIESQVMAWAGGAAGLVLAAVSVRALVRFAPPVPRLEQASIDGIAMAYALVLSIVTGLLFGLVPAWRALSPDLAHWLRQGGRTSADAGASARVRTTLVVLEVALSFVLLAAAGLLFTSFMALRGVDAGVRPERVLTLRMSLPERLYPDPAAVSATYREIASRVRNAPGVLAAGFTLDVPLASDHQGTRLRFDGEAEPTDDQNRSVHFSVATPGYFEAMGIPLVLGRDFTPADAAGMPGVVIVNEVLVRQHMSGQDPLGRRILFDEPRTIVGVIGAVRLEQLSNDPTPAMIFPHEQMPYGYRSLSLAVRTRGEPLAMVNTVRAAIRSVDAEIPVYSVRTMEQVLSASMAQPRFSSLLLLAFSAVALALAAVGIYGVIAWMVNQRTREIGIRMALGARPADALSLIVGQGMRLALAGVIAGLVISLLLARTLTSLLYGVRPADPVTLLSVSAFLLAVALAACALPAWRASRLDPLRALRQE